MSYGSPILRQHVVEFIRGTGIVTDGVTNATSVNGPWTWVVPSGVSNIRITGTGAGSSGGAGGYVASALSAAGGAGGQGAVLVSNLAADVTPNSSLTITIGARGVGSASYAGDYGAGGNTTISGLLSRLPVLNGLLALTGGGVLFWLGSAPTSSTSAVATTGQGNSTAGAAGALENREEGRGFWGEDLHNAYPTGNSGQGGGGVAGGVAGAQGGYSTRLYNFLSNMSNTSTSIWSQKSAGTTSGGASFGGGGTGSPSFFTGAAAKGGDGDTVGNSVAASDYGAGGGGGGGSATAIRAGGSGGDGYARFTYWSVD